jgi:nucleoside-diphosphate-sugar epimerase
MRVVITGGGGFLGWRLARELLRLGKLTAAGRESPIERVVLFDLSLPREAAGSDPRLELVQGDITDPSQVRAAVSPGTGSVFHLAAVVSAAAEEDFDLGLRVNLEGTRHLLEACRSLPEPARLVYASSIAVYGGEKTINDRTPATPLNSYGVQKAVGELLLRDYARKGYVDGRGLRLPTVIVRPGKPNRAASSFASSIVREPLMGERAVCPVSPGSFMPVLSPRRVIEAFIHAHELPAEAFGGQRVLLLDGLSPTVAQILHALRRVAGQEVADRVDFQPNPFIQRIVDGWPRRLEARRARELGFRRDGSVEEIIRQFIAEQLPRRDAQGSGARA